MKASFKPSRDLLQPVHGRPSTCSDLALTGATKLSGPGSGKIHRAQPSPEPGGSFFQLAPMPLASGFTSLRSGPRPRRPTSLFFSRHTSYLELKSVAAHKAHAITGPPSRGLIRFGLKMPLISAIECVPVRLVSQWVLPRWAVFPPGTHSRPLLLLILSRMPACFRVLLR